MADLWIRTQEGVNRYGNNQNTLIQCTNIIEENGNLLTIQDNKTYILGTYDTKERAKEVLDGIQKTFSSTDCEIIPTNNTNIVYTMPKE